MKKILTILLATMTIASAGFFQEEDKQKHIKYSIPFGVVGGMICKGDRAFNLSGWQAISCGTLIGMIPGLAKEALDQHNYNGWDNRDLGADFIGAFIGSIGTVTIWEFQSGKW